GFFDGGDAEALGVVDFFEKDAGALGLFAEGVGGGGDVAFDDVVAEDDGDLAAVGEIFGEAESVGDAAFAFPMGEGEFAQPYGFAVAKKFDESAGVFATCDDEDVRDSRVSQAVDRVHDHGLVVDGKKMLVGDFGQGAQASAQAAGENYALHG